MQSPGQVEPHEVYSNLTYADAMDRVGDVRDEVSVPTSLIDFEEFSSVLMKFFSTKHFAVRSGTG